MNADMVVANADDSDIGVYFGNGDGTFQAPVTYSVAGSLSLFPIAVAVGDLNGDGISDIVVANYNITSITLGNTVSVFLGNSDGTFQGAKTYPVGAEATAVVLADFDGNLDIVTADQGDGTVSFLGGNGDGTFKPRVTFTVGTGPHALVTGDFNGDGNLDLAVADCPSQLRTDPFSCQPDGSGIVTILLGDGHGSFTAQAPIQVAADPIALAIGDLNGDGHVDLAVAHDVRSGGVGVLLGRGDGTFGLETILPAGDYVGSVAIADFNGDGHMDIIGYNGNSVFSELLGNGDGTFQPPVNYGLPMGASVGLVQADLNGDGKPDLVMVNSENVVSSFLNISGTTRAPTSLSLVAAPNPAVTTGASIDLTATLTASPLPAGTVTFALDGVPVFGQGLSAVGGVNASGQALAYINTTAGNPLVAGNHTLTAVYSGNDTTEASTTSVPLTVNLTPTTIFLSTTANPAAPGAAVEFDTCVGMSSQFSNGNLGSVSFYDGTTLLGTSPLSPYGMGGCSNASFTTSQLAPGTHSITAQYSGSAVYEASTSTAVSETIAAVTPDFSVNLMDSNPGAGTQTVTAGTSADWGIAVTSLNGWQGAVSLTCSGVPVLASCQVSGSVDVGAGTTDVDVKVTTAAPMTAALGPRLPWHPREIFSALSGAAVVRGRARRGRSRGWRLTASALAPLLLVLALLAACGGGSGGSGSTAGSPGTPAGSYTITVTATAGSVSHAQTVTLVVQ